MIPNKFQRTSQHEISLSFQKDRVFALPCFNNIIFLQRLPSLIIKPSYIQLYSKDVENPTNFSLIVVCMYHICFFQLQDLFLKLISKLIPQHERYSQNGFLVKINTLQPTLILRRSSRKLLNFPFSHGQKCETVVSAPPFHIPHFPRLGLVGKAALVNKISPPQGETPNF